MSPLLGPWGARWACPFRSPGIRNVGFWRGASTFGVADAKNPDSLKLSKNTFCLQNLERQTMPKNEEAALTTEAKPEAAQTSDARAEATSTVRDELTEEALDDIAGGIRGAELGVVGLMKRI